MYVNPCSAESPLVLRGGNMEMLPQVILFSGWYFSVILGTGIYMLQKCGEGSTKIKKSSLSEGWNRVPFSTISTLLFSRLFISLCLRMIGGNQESPQSQNHAVGSNWKIAQNWWFEVLEVGTAELYFSLTSQVRLSLPFLVGTSTFPLKFLFFPSEDRLIQVVLTPGEPSVYSFFQGPCTHRWNYWKKDMFS